VRELLLERITVRKARYALFVRGLAASPVRGILVRDSAFRGVSDGSRLENVAELVLRNVVIEPEAHAPPGKESR
jgi:hypothetical protein